MKRNFGNTFGRTEEGYIEERRELEERLKKEPAAIPETPPTPVMQPVNITPNNNSWLIEDDKYRIQLSKSLIPSGTQEQQIKNYLANPGSFNLANYLQLFLIGRMLFNNNTSQKDEILNFLRDSFKNNWIQTSSGVLYKPNGKDAIIHDKGMPSEYSLEADFIGPDRYIEQADETALKHLTGLHNLDEIKKISQFLANKDKTYLWRLNSKPEQVDYRVAGFNAYLGRADLDCFWVPQFSDSGLGVKVAKKI